jgi:hypothetical protein
MIACLLLTRIGYCNCWSNIHHLVSCILLGDAICGEQLDSELHFQKKNEKKILKKNIIQAQGLLS